MPTLSSTKNSEEMKREKNTNPLKRWYQIQNAISWAETNMKLEYRRNRPRPPHLFHKMKQSV